MNSGSTSCEMRVAPNRRPLGARAEVVTGSSHSAKRDTDDLVQRACATAAAGMRSPMSSADSSCAISASEPAPNKPNKGEQPRRHALCSPRSGVCRGEIERGGCTRRAREQRGRKRCLPCVPETSDPQTRGRKVGKGVEPVDPRSRSPAYPGLPARAPEFRPPGAPGCTPFLPVAPDRCTTVVYR